MVAQLNLLHSKELCPASSKLHPGCWRSTLKLSMFDDKDNMLPCAVSPRRRHMCSIAAVSLLFFSSLLMPSSGVRSPTIAAGNQHAIIQRWPSWQRNSWPLLAAFTIVSLSSLEHQSRCCVLWRQSSRFNQAYTFCNRRRILRPAKRWSTLSQWVYSSGQLALKNTDNLDRLCKTCLD